MTEELLDVIEPTGSLIGTARRADVHVQGLWHQSFHCLMVRTGQPAKVVLQRRRLDARGFPGFLDLTATGHLAAGESPFDGRRELLEEVGIDVDPSALVPLGRRLLADDLGEGRNREVMHVFLFADDRPFDAIPITDGDAESVVELLVDDLLAVLADQSATVMATEWDGRSPVRTIPVTGTDLVPSSDGYWTVIAVMAARFAAGEIPLAI